MKYKALKRYLTHGGRMAHICVGNLTIIGSDNGLSPGCRQAIIWTSVTIFLFGPSRTNFSEISIESLTCSFKKMRLKVSSAKWRPYCFGLNVLIQHNRIAAKLSKVMGTSYYILVHGTEKDGMREVDVLDNDFDISRYTPISQYLMVGIYTERYQKSDYKSIRFISETIVSA